MKRSAEILSAIIALALSGGYGQNASAVSLQTGSDAAEQTSVSGQPDTAPHSKEHKNSKSAGAEAGSGMGDIGKGVGKGAGDLAKGTGKGAVDLVTLHPVNAATDIGKGAGKAGGHVAVGTVKGTGKVVKGTGKAIKKIF